MFRKGHQLFPWQESSVLLEVPNPHEPKTQNIQIA